MTATRRLLLGAALTAAVLATPAAASAATSIELTDSRLDITGDAFANRITVSRSGDAFTVEDTLADLPNVAIAARARRTGDGVTLRIACPPTAARACRGSVVLLDARGRTVSARPGRFALRRGARAAIRLRMRGAARGLIAVATERAPDGRPKTTRLPLRLRR